MADGYIEVAKAAVTIVPTMEGAQKTITEELSSAGTAAGKSAGKATGGAMLTSIGSKMSSVGGVLTSKVTAPLVSLGSAALDAFQNVDAGMDIIVTKTGASGEALAGMNQVFNSIATSMPADFETIGSAIGEVNTKFGLTGSALQDLSEQFIMFADINGQDVSASVDRVRNVLAAFGMEASEAGNLLDAFNVVGQSTGMDVGALADTLSANAGLFESLGWSAYDAAGFLSDVAVSGVDSSTAMTALKKAMAYAVQNGTDLDTVLSGFMDTMQGNATESEKLSAAYELFGSKAGAAIYNAVQNGTLDLSNFTNSLGDFSGSVANTFEAAQDPIDGFQTVTNALSIAGAQLVESAAPAITTAVETILPVITGLSDAWNKLPSGMQTTIIYAGLFSAVLGPVTSKVGPLVSGLGGLVSKITSLGNKGGGAAEALEGLSEAAGDAAGPTSNAATSFGNLAGQSLKLVAAGVTIWIVAQALGDLAETAIQLAEAGPGAEAAMAGLVVAMGGLIAVVESVSKTSASFSSLAGSSLQLVAAAGAIWVVAQAFDTLADTAIKLSEAGTGAEAAMAVMVGAMGGLIAVVETVSKTSASFTSLAGSAVMLAATAASIWIIADAFDKLADTAIKITEAGTPAEVAMGAMAATIGVLMGAAAALGPALDAGAVGILAFGTAVLEIGAGIDLATQGIAALAEALGDASLKFAESAPALADAFGSAVESISGGVVEILDGVGDLSTTIAESSQTMADAFGTAMTAISDSIVTVLGAVGDLSTTFAASSTTVAESFGTVVTAVSDGVATIVTAIGDSLSKVLDSVAGIFDSIGTAALNAGTGFSMLSDAVIRLVNETGVVDLAATFTKTSDGIKSLTKQAKNSADAVTPLNNTTTALNSFAAALGTELDGAVTTATADLATLQELFDGTILTLPETYIPVPHFSVFSGQSPYGINGQGAVPYMTVSWYAKAAQEGAVFDSPQIIGVGDASEPEYLLGRSALQDQLLDMVQSGGSSPVVDAIAAMTAEIVAAIQEADHEISVDGRTIARVLTKYQRQNARATT